MPRKGILRLGALTSAWGIVVMLLAGAVAGGPQPRAAPRQAPRIWQLREIAVQIYKPGRPERALVLATTARSISELGTWKIPSGGEAEMSLRLLLDIPPQVTEGQDPAMGAGGSADAGTSGIARDLFPFAEFQVVGGSCPRTPLQSQRGLGNRSHSFSAPVQSCPRSTSQLPDTWTWLASGVVTIYGGKESDGSDGVSINVKVTYGLCPDGAGCVAGLDLVADGLEVTQAVQDLRNNVRLVAHKRTYVRFHVHATDKEPLATARLTIRAGGTSATIPPQPVTERITVRRSPDRAILNQAFVFELPDKFTEGTVNLSAELNPPAGGRRPVDEKVLSNNSAQTTVRFEEVPPINLVVYEVTYGEDDREYAPRAFEVGQMLDWLRRAYPVSEIRPWLRSFVHPGLHPNCAFVNIDLSLKRLGDQMSGSPEGIPANARHYGMISDAAAVLGGCAVSIPGWVASGPAGVPGRNLSQSGGGWDDDDSYGDWVGGHELAHTYGRHHAEFCGARAGRGLPLAYPPSYVPYPHPNGELSPVHDGDGALYGFDIKTFRIYPPQWHDLMTYCSELWVSDVTTHGLMDAFQAQGRGSFVAGLGERADRLRVAGILDPAGKASRLDPMFVLPDAPDPGTRVPGPYAIVLRGAVGTELARFPFTPAEVRGTAPPGGPMAEPEVDLLAITELVPYLPGTVRVDVEGPGASVLLSRSAGAAAPALTVTEPSAGVILSGDRLQVAWSASDPDGDPLSYEVAYSPDGGASWEIVAQRLKQTTISVAAVNVVASRAGGGRFRVLATDGIHTTAATSAAFSVPNRAPTARITLPPAPVTIAADQTLRLEAEVYDVDAGPLAGAAVTWTSSRDGLLGRGPRTSLAGLSDGLHVIGLRAEDPAGAVATDTVTVTVLAAGAPLPPLPGALLAGPESVDLAPGGSRRLTVSNQNTDQVVAWTATANEPWLRLSASSGNTPADLMVTVASQPLAEGASATIRFSSPDLSGGEAVVRIALRRPTGAMTFLPLVGRGLYTRSLPAPATSVPPGTLNPRPSAPATATATVTERAATATPTLVASTTATASSTPTTSPSATPAAELSLVEAYTADPNGWPRSAFVALEYFQLGMEIHSLRPANVTLSYEVRDPAGELVAPWSWSGPMTLQPDLPYLVLARQVPTDLPSGRYSFTGRVTGPGGTQTAVAVFYLANALIRAEDFSDPASGWPTAATDPTRAELGYLGGGYRIFVKATDWLVWASGGARAAGLVLEADTWLLGADGDCGLLWGLDDAGTAGQALDVDRGGRFRLLALSATGGRVLQNWTPHAALRPAGALNHLMAVHSGSNIEVFANGQPLGALSAAPAADGRVAVIAGSRSEPGVDGRFDNVRLYRLP